MTDNPLISTPRRWLHRVVRRAPVVAVLRLSGVIATSSRLHAGLNLATLAPHIEAAFRQRRLKAVALAINSPGGSPAQTSLIFRRIRALATENDIPVLAFTEDVAASGGYWLACAADEIFADESSIIGSIGVVASSFGFVELMQKFGVERRLHTQGDKKSLMDPFSPEKPADVRRLMALQKNIFEAFKDTVRERRGEKLTLAERQAFSGEIWTGRKALEHGLIDGIGDLRSVMRERYGDDVRFKVLGREPGLLSRLMRRRFSGTATTYPDTPMMPGNWADQLISAVETRTLWSRFGL
jgi:signal peptide peptidase SppA